MKNDNHATFTSNTYVLSKIPQYRKINRKKTQLYYKDYNKNLGIPDCLLLKKMERSFPSLTECPDWSEEF